VPFSSVEIGLPEDEDQEPVIERSALEELKTAGISDIPFFCPFSRHAHFSNSKRRGRGVFLQTRKAPQNRPKKLQTVKIQIGARLFLYSNLGRPCASGSWRHFALCECGATAQFSGVGDGPPHMAETRGIDGCFGGFTAAG
jgi:hypothetical protein